MKGIPCDEKGEEVIVAVAVVKESDEGKKLRSYDKILFAEQFLFIKSSMQLNVKYIKQE